MNPATDTKLFFAEGYRYQVYKDFTIQTKMTGYSVEHPFFSLRPDGLLIIRRGYAWDGASGLLTMQTQSNKRSSLVHDVFYQMLRAGLLPHNPCFHLANEELRRISIEDGMFKFRANYFFAAVERFGDAYAAVQPDKVFTAPK